MGNVESDCKDIATDKCVKGETCNAKVKSLSIATGIGWGTSVLCCCCCIIWMIISMVLLQKMNSQ